MHISICNSKHTIYMVLLLYNKSACPPSSRVSPFCLRQSPTGRATLTARTLSDVASLCHLSLWCKTIRAHQRLRTNSGAWGSLPRRRCSSRSVFEQVSACKKYNCRRQYNFAKIHYFCKIKGTRLSAFIVSRLRSLKSNFE